MNVGGFDVREVTSMCRRSTMLRCSGLHHTTEMTGLRSSEARVKVLCLHHTAMSAIRVSQARVGVRSSSCATYCALLVVTAGIHAAPRFQSISSRCCWESAWPSSSRVRTERCWRRCGLANRRHRTLPALDLAGYPGNSATPPGCLAPTS